MQRVSLPEMWLRRQVRAWRAWREARAYRAANLRFELSGGKEILIRNRAEWCAFTDIFCRGIYDAAITRAVAKENSGAPLNVIDLGANVGFFALRLLQQVRQNCNQHLNICMYLIEPSVGAMRDLRDRLSGEEQPNLRLHFVEGLAGKRGGSAWLHESAFHIGNRIDGDPYCTKRQAPYIDLEELTKANSAIHLFKCDIEGAEQDLLENYPQLLQKVEVGAMELHHELCDTRRCREILRQAGFQIFPVRQTEWFDEIWFEKTLSSGAT